MKRILIASIAAIAFAGTAAAQEAPVHYGDYGTSVENSFNATSQTPNEKLTIDTTETSSIAEKLPTTDEQDIRSGM